MAPIVGLTHTGSAPIAEEPLRFCIGAQPEIFELSDAGAADAVAYIACEIKHRVPRSLRWREETCIGGIGHTKALNKFWTDFVVRLPDGRSERGGNSAAIGAKLFHRSNRRFNHACERTAPTRMGGAYYADPAIGKQQRSTVGG